MMRLLPEPSGEDVRARKEKEEAQMNWDQIQGKWKQSMGKVKEKWGKLTDDDMNMVNGRREQLVGKVQERYGLAKEAAEKQVDEFARSLREQDFVVVEAPVGTSTDKSRKAKA
jgi:uncharacterized protein YjbJ (UPF0337 family)